MSEICFFITPIGSVGSQERIRADSIQEHILQPCLGGLCEVVRADRIAEPGSITTQIFRLLVESKFAVADLSDLNPNVMYELGVRHSFNLPSVILLDRGQRPPFDLYSERAVQFDIADLTSHEDAKKAIKSFILHSMKGGDYASPVISSISLAAELRESSQNILSKLTSSITDLEYEVQELNSNISLTDTSDLEDELKEVNQKLSLLFKLVNQTIKTP